MERRNVRSKVRRKREYKATTFETPTIKRTEKPSNIMSLMLDSFRNGSPSEDVQGELFSNIYIDEIQDVGLGLCYAPSEAESSPSKRQSLNLIPLQHSSRSDLKSFKAEVGQVASVLVLAEKYAVKSLISNLIDLLKKEGVMCNVTFSVSPSEQEIRASDYYLFFYMLDRCLSLDQMVIRIKKIMSFSGPVIFNSTIIGIYSKKGPGENIVMGKDIHEVIKKYQLKYQIWQTMQGDSMSHVIKCLRDDICAVVYPKYANSRYLQWGLQKQIYFYNTTQ